MTKAELTAKRLGLDVEDICTKCHEDEEYDFGLCIGCVEESLEDGEW